MAASLTSPRRKRLKQALFVLTPAAFFLLYILTLSPDVLPADAGEFQVVVPLLGVAHPPGFPLYTLAGRVFTGLFGFLSPARTLNFFSALTGALTLGVVALTVRRFTPSPWPGLLAASALGVSTTFWSQSTTANIRSLTGLFTALCLYALSVSRAKGDVPSVTGHGSRFTFDDPPSTLHAPTPIVHALRSLLHAPRSTLFFLLLSFGILHHPSLLFMGVVFISYWLLQERNYAHPRRWLAPIGLGLVPLVVLLYLPLRGAQGAFLAPPHLATWSGFWEHVLARGFEGDFFYFAHLADFPNRLSILGNLLNFQFNPLLLAGFALALVFAFFVDWRYNLMLLASFAVHTFVSITYRAPQTVEYLLPAYVVMAVGLGIGVSRITCHVSRVTFDVLRFAFPILLLLFSLGVLSLFSRNLSSYQALSRDKSTREYAEGLLLAAPEGAAVLASWHWATPMWYLQEVEGLRPDVEVIYVFPEGESLAETWVRRIGETLVVRPVVVTSYYPSEFGATGYRFLPLGPAWEVRDRPVTEAPPELQPVNAVFGERWRLAGYRLERLALAPGESTAVTLAWQNTGPSEDINFFAQLIGPDGSLYAQVDFSHPARTYQAEEGLVDRGLLTLRVDALPGDYALIAGAYTPDGVRLVTPDDQDFIRLGVVQVGMAQTPPVTRHQHYFRSVGAVRLVGHDFDLTLPERARLYLHWRLGDSPQPVVVWAGEEPFIQLTLPPGSGYLTTATDLPFDQPISLTPDHHAPSWLSPRFPAADPGERYQALGSALVLTGVQIAQTGPDEFRVDLDWLSAGPLTEDYIVKVDLVGPGYAWRVGSDNVPAGGAIPTLKWVRGSLVHDRHRLIAPEGAEGIARLELAVYDHFTQRVLPILDPDVALLGATVPLGAVEAP